MEKIDSKLIRIDGIAGMHYKAPVKTNALVIYGIGAPIPPDSGHLPDAPIALAKGVDILVPDYIGYGRSDGDFTPVNCIKTFTNLFERLQDGTRATNTYLGEGNIPLQYDRIMFVGRSFGGTYVPVLPRFNDQIKDLAVFSAVVDSKSCGNVPGEETNERFLDSMREDGYHHLYRGILKPEWEGHLENRDDLSPMDNVLYLRDARLFIAHGIKDDCVDYSKAVAYYEKIKADLPGKESQFKLALYPDGNHGPSTTNPAMQDYLEWVNP